MESQFWLEVRQRASDLHEQRVSVLEFLQEVVQLITSNRTELPLDVVRQLKECFRNQDKEAPRIKNRVQALKRVESLKRDDIEPPEFLESAIAHYNVHGFAFWEDGLKTTTKENFGNVICAIYHGLRRVKTSNRIHRAFYSLAIYNLIRKIMAFSEVTSLTRPVVECFTSLVLNGKQDPTMRATIEKDVRREYKKGVIYSSYVENLGYGCFFYMFNAVPSYLYVDYLHASADVSRVSLHLRQIGGLEIVEMTGAAEVGYNIMDSVTIRFDGDVQMLIQDRLLRIRVDNGRKAELRASKRRRIERIPGIQALSVEKQNAQKQPPTSNRRVRIAHTQHADACDTRWSESRRPDRLQAGHNATRNLPDMSVAEQTPNTQKRPHEFTVPASKRPRFLSRDTSDEGHGILTPADGSQCSADDNSNEQSTDSIATDLTEDGNLTEAIAQPSKEPRQSVLSATGLTRDEAAASNISTPSTELMACIATHACELVAAHNALTSGEGVELRPSKRRRTANDEEGNPRNTEGLSFSDEVQSTRNYAPGEASVNQFMQWYGTRYAPTPMPEQASTSDNRYGTQYAPTPTPEQVSVNQFMQRYGTRYEPAPVPEQASTSVNQYGTQYAPAPEPALTSFNQAMQQYGTLYVPAPVPEQASVNQFMQRYGTRYEPAPVPEQASTPVNQYGTQYAPAPEPAFTSFNKAMQQYGTLYEPAPVPEQASTSVNQYGMQYAPAPTSEKASVNQVMQQYGNRYFPADAPAPIHMSSNGQANGPTDTLAAHLTPHGILMDVQNG